MKTLIEKIDLFIEKEETEYQKFFRETLKKYGVDEPDQLSKEEKKKFFDEIDVGWKSKKEKKGIDEATMKYIFKSIEDKEKVVNYLNDKEIDFKEEDKQIIVDEKDLDKSAMKFIQKVKMNK